MSLDAASLEYLAFIIEGAARMKRLIEGILEYSRAHQFRAAWIREIGNQIRH